MLVKAVTHITAHAGCPLHAPATQQICSPLPITTLVDVAGNRQQRQAFLRDAHQQQQLQTRSGCSCCQCCTVTTHLPSHPTVA